MWSGSDTTSGLQAGGSDATSYSTGPPLIERWPFYGRCWNRFVLSLSALDFFQAARTTFQVSLESISHTRWYYGRHKVPIEL